MSRWPRLLEIAVAFLVFLLPWQTRWIFEQGMIKGIETEVGTISLTVAQLLLLLLGIATLGRRSASSSMPVLARWTLALLCIAFLSLYWATDLRWGLWSVVQLALAAIVVGIAATMPVRRSTVAVALLAAGVVQSLLAGIQFFSLEIPALEWLGLAAHSASTLGDSVVQTESSRFLRAYGSLPHPNMLGGFLALASWSGLLLVQKKSRWTLAIYTAIALIGFGLVFTFSRGAGLALIVGWIGVFIALALTRMNPTLRQDRRVSGRVLSAESRLRRQIFSSAQPRGETTGYSRGIKKDFRSTLPIALTLILSIATAAAIISPLLISRITAEHRIERQSVQSRKQQLDDAWTLIKKYAMTGTGVGNAIPALVQLDDSRSGYAYQPVHIVPLLILIELGVFGLGLWLLIVATALLSAITAVRDHGPSPENLALLGMTLTILVLSGFDHYLWSLPTGLSLFFLIVSFRLFEKETPN